MRQALILATIAALAAACVAAPSAPPPAPPAASPVAIAPANCTPAPSELVIEDLAPGEGPSLGYKSAANMWYSGWLYDGCKPDFKGKPFDSNIGKMPLPLMVGVGRVILGWDEGLVGMKAKGKRLLIIPPNKAYGPREVPGGAIPPNSTLVFEVEVMNIVAQPAQ
ncbi:MAG: FKBP-type peptidyl-prolyl cis-trans isomerase [Usitatibacter sp.]